MPLIWPMHPRTKKNIKKLNLKINKNLQILNPVDFFKFVNLELNSYCVLTDSGTVQEECSIFKIPNIILREKTERPETIESGSSLVVMNDLYGVINGIKFSVENNNPSDVQGYSDLNVSEKILKIILSNYEFDKK